MSGPNGIRSSLADVSILIYIGCAIGTSNHLGFVQVETIGKNCIGRYQIGSIVPGCASGSTADFALLPIESDEIFSRLNR